MTSPRRRPPRDGASSVVQALLVAGLLSLARAAHAEFALTEFMAANQATLADEDGAFSDWIEIHNADAAEANLAGWFLSDDPGDLKKWQFPSTPVPAGGYVIVFASDHDRRVAGAPLHTNFRLNAEGGYLAVVRPEGTLATAYGSATTPYSAQAEDISYGLTTSVPPAVRYFTMPTPGWSNIGGVRNARLTPLFSVGSRAFNSVLTVALSSPLAGAEIRYTTNGEIPTELSLRYTVPLTFTSSTRLRAALIFTDEPPGPSATETYLRLSPSAQQFRSPLPIVVLDNFGSGPVPGVNGRGPNRDGSGVVEVFMQPHALLIFDRTNGAAGFAQAPVTASRAGMKLRGSSSFDFPRKSYALETWGEGDDEARDLPLLGMPSESDWVLYSPDFSQFDASLIHNSFLYALANQSGYYAPRTRFVEVFLNTTGTSLGTEHYAGLFLLIEKVKRGKDRVAFERLAPNGTTGGWMINVDRMDPLPPGSLPWSTLPRHFHTAGPDRILQTEDDNPYGYQGPLGGFGVPPPRDDQPNFYHSFFNFESPSGWDITPAQRNAIQGFVRAFDAALYGPNFTHPTYGYAPFIDVENFVHHFILHSFAKNQDAEVLSAFLVRETPNGKLRHGPIWDVDRAFNRNPNGPDPFALPKWASDRLFYPRLFSDVNFNQAYIDKWQELRRGPFATSNLLALVDAQTNEITATVAGRHGLAPFVWAYNVSEMRNWLANRATAIDAQFLAPPVFSRAGGAVPNGFQLAIFGGVGTIYFTTDGRDPRAPGGLIAPTAQAFTLPITLHAPTTVFARSRSGVTWSGITRATFFTPQDLDALRLTELMYHPPDVSVGPELVSGNEFEFLELKNTGAATLDLSGLTFTSGISFSFPVGTTLAPGAFFVLGRNADRLRSKYPGLSVNGVFASGQLDNSGEQLRLSYPNGLPLFSLTYEDVAPWPVPADGYGYSLVPRDSVATGDPNVALNWRASTHPGGSPGADDPPNAIPPVRVNEVLSASAPFASDAIELFNPTASVVDIGGWFLSDDSAAPKKFQIPPDTLMDPGGFVVFDETQFNPTPGAPDSFALSSAGDEIYLFSGDAATNLTGYSHGFIFGGAEAGVTFGRVPLGDDDELFCAQSAPTLGTENAGPRPGPVVLSEIHYNPGPGGDEFVELRNITSTNVTLFDKAVPEHTWRLDGLGFVFPTNLALEAGQSLLLVGIDPAVFRTKYSVPANLMLLGPYAGLLQDSGERLELQQLYTQGTNSYYVTIDAVRYNDRMPWPPAADGGGFSLQRRALAELGDDPANWTAAPPTPGTNLPSGDAPRILVQPQNRQIPLGQPVTFSVSASGTEPMSYQWRWNGSPIPGAGQNEFTLPAAQSADAGTYSVLVYNDVGSVLSSNAVLTVAAPPVLLSQPRSVTLRGSTSPATYGQTGQNVTFSVLATGLAPLEYQWQWNGASIPGARTASITLSNVTLAHEGVYRVIVTDATGSTTSSNAVLTVLVTPIFTQAPASQTILAGSTVTWTVAVTGNPLPLGFEWKRFTGNISLASNTVAGRTDSFTLVNVQPAQAGVYGVIVRNPALPSGSTTSFFLTVLNPAVDTDGDGLTNGQESLAGTNPLDPKSCLRVDRISRGVGLVQLEVFAVSNRTYTLQATDGLEPLTWQRLADIPAQPMNRTEAVTDTGGHRQRFYRVVTPRVP